MSSQIIRHVALLVLATFATNGFSQYGSPKALTHPTGGTNDYFGQSVAVDGDTMVVGAQYDDVGTFADQGSTHVFRWTGYDWVLEATLTAADGAASDRFGTSVAISGSTIVVGASGDDLPNAADQGSVYVFVRNGQTWTQQAKLVTSDGFPLDAFGASVSIDADTIAAGATGDDIGATVNQGSVYVYTRSGTTWTQQSKLIAADGLAGDAFGTSVSISGDSVISGVPFADLGGVVNQGFAYIHSRTGMNWTQQAKLMLADGVASDNFGFSVSISQDTAVVGAYGRDIGAVTNQGAAYVFTRSGGTWSAPVQLAAADGAASDSFGYSVSVSGDQMIIGAPYDDVGANSNQGTASIYRRLGNSWIFVLQLIAEDGAASDYFGWSVADSLSATAVGAPYDDVGGVTNAGSARAYTRPRNASSTSAGVSGTGVAVRPWPLVQGEVLSGGYGDSIAISNGLMAVTNSASSSSRVYLHRFISPTESVQETVLAVNANTVALDGNTLAVGSPYDMPPGALFDSGSVSIYTKVGNSWVFETKLAPSDLNYGHRFGTRLALKDGILVVGCPSADLGNADVGAVHIFAKEGGVWVRQAKFTPSVYNGFEEFGAAVAISNGMVFVGQPEYGGPGKIYVYSRTGSNWVQAAMLQTNDAGAGPAEFGRSIAVVGNTLIGGAPSARVGSTDVGAAYVFTLSGGTWSQSAKISPPSNASQQFGAAVGLTSGCAVIGAPFLSSGSVNAGGAFVYSLNNSTWTLTSTITQTSGANSDRFGGTIAMSDGTCAIAADGRAPLSGQTGSGVVYLYSYFDSEIQSVRNNVTNATFSTMGAAVLAAASGHQLTASPSAWGAVGTLDTLGKSLGLTSEAEIRLPSTSIVNLGGSSWLGTADGNELEIFGQLRLATGSSADLTGGQVVVGARGSMTARTGSSLTVNAGDMLQMNGALRIESGATFTSNVDSGYVTASTVTMSPDSTWMSNQPIVLSGSLQASTIQLNAPAFSNSGSSQLTGPVSLYGSVFNTDTMNFFGSSSIFGSMTNYATTTIRSGTLYIYGSLTNNGTIIGTICSGCTSTPPNMDIGGSLNLGSAANLNMPFLGSTVRVGGNFDCAINSNTRYDMSLATLQLEGNGSEQTLEVMSFDIGADVNGLDRSISGHYPINTLHIGTSPSVVRLVDSHDNDGSGQAVCEAIYVDTLRIEAGSRLINTSCKIYYNTLINNGVIDVPSNLISLQPTFCPSDFDQSGSVDGDDVIGFFAAWDNGDIAADFDQSGSVDGDDVIGFFAAWDAGC